MKLLSRILLIFTFATTFIVDNTFRTVSGEEYGTELNNDHIGQEDPSLSLFGWWSDDDVTVNEKQDESLLLTADTPPQSHTNQNSYLSWIKDVLGSDDQQAPSSDLLSSNLLLNYLVSDVEAEEMLSLLLDMYGTDNTSYLTSLSAFVKIFLYFMPKSGLLNQARFSYAMMKITAKATIMYFQNYSELEIAISVLPEMMYAATLRRRDASDDIQFLLKPGEVVDIHSMDAGKFIEYVKHVHFPALSDAQEEEIRIDVLQLVSENFPNLPAENHQLLVQSLINTVKFFAAFRPNGELQMDNSDSTVQQISEIYKSMHSIF